MNTKNILIGVGALIGAFLISAVISFYIYPVIHPEVKKKKEDQSKKEIAQSDSVKNINPEVRKLTLRISQLQMSNDTLNHLTTSQSNQIDSLQSLLDIKSKQLAQLQKNVVVKQNQNIEETVKSVLNLDEDALSPIVNKLSYSELLVLYKKASSMQKEKLLKSLNSDKAAEILKKVMS